MARRTRCGGVRTASQIRRAPSVGELDGDVGGRIAGADNEDVAVAERPSVSETAGVNESRR